MRSYNLFRLKDPSGLVCAVPEDYAVPSFVTGSRWVFDGKLDGSAHPLGFDRAAAATAVRFNGFYLFQCMDAGSA
ncbi:hypothetical protein [Methylobacterium nodulans]|uniref:Uncharacterized protein n=1 Tax=Methylobacterium nodulans (strain LMG 21967 / CNCM I-2342 / ORS 2060) TaxID=460265 RepID=B8IFM0_METNO|nr:hypothetical protein [Methylobacterium nodulans]ACL57755.1 conserved hypothetical protein [Methylobacterium nodulans ORS 2060]